MDPQRQIILMALQEDLPDGDITTNALKTEKTGKALLIAKSQMVLSGSSIFEEVFKTVDPEISIEWKFMDGKKIKPKGVICIVEGRLSSLLKAERVALNFLGHLSGVATLTHAFVEKIKITKCKITDTRKTTPGMRTLEKAAVRHGGGINHRMSLSDQFLIKENHIRTAGGITQAVKNCRSLHPEKKIEVEVTDLKELKEALKAEAQRIMLDNMSVLEMKRAVKLTKKQAELEASGNMNLETVLKVAKTGVDFISVGKITHSAPVADVSLLFEEK